jgi:DAACS family dicarboxylate/amino acid:cation (Na+ or H+) symporter
MAGLVIGAALGIVANFAGTRLAVPPAEEAVGDDRPESRWSWFRDDDNENGIADGVDYLAGNVADPLGRVFLRLVLMVVLPLVISALALGVVGIGDVRKLGRVGVRTLVLTGGLSLTAVLIGVTLVNSIRPGESLSPEKRESLQEQYASGAGEAVERAGKAKPLATVLLDIIPENPLQEMAGAVDGSSKGNGMLAVMFFALVLGVALATLPGEKSRPLVAVLEALFDVSMAVIQFAMRLAPVAVALLVFALTARLGFDILGALAWLVLTVLAGLAVQLVIVYSVLLRLAGGIRPLEFFKGARDAMWTALGTSSSNATLPTAMRVAREDLGITNNVADFVLTIGATGNQNGTALYEGVVVLFLAQVFGVELSLVQQFTVVLMSVLAGVGTAGVPGGSLPMIVVVMQSVGVPAEGIGVILGIDRLLDMCRTVVNVTGDLVVARCVDAWETSAVQPA